MIRDRVVLAARVVAVEASGGAVEVAYWMAKATLATRVRMYAAMGRVAVDFEDGAHALLDLRISLWKQWFKKK